MGDFCTSKELKQKRNIKSNRSEFKCAGRMQRCSSRP